MEPCIKSVGLGKRDAVINKWRNTVMNQEDRMVSFLVKQALLSFVNDGTFIEIGRIHFDPKSDVVKGQPRMNIWLEDAPDLINWVKELEEKKIPVTKVFKEILLKSIKVVPENENEYIPTYYEIATNTGGVLSAVMGTPLKKQTAMHLNEAPKEVINKEKVKQEIKNVPSVAIEKGNSKKQAEGKNVIGMLGLGVKR